MFFLWLFHNGHGRSYNTACRGTLICLHGRPIMGKTEANIVCVLLPPITLTAGSNRDPLTWGGGGGHPPEEEGSRKVYFAHEETADQR